MLEYMTNLYEKGVYMLDFILKKLTKELGNLEQQLKDTEVNHESLEININNLETYLESIREYNKEQSVHATVYFFGAIISFLGNLFLSPLFVILFLIFAGLTCYSSYQFNTTKEDSPFYNEKVDKLNIYLEKLSENNFNLQYLKQQILSTQNNLKSLNKYIESLDDSIHFDEYLNERVDYSDIHFNNQITDEIEYGDETKNLFKEYSKKLEKHI